LWFGQCVFSKKEMSMYKCENVSACGLWERVCVCVFGKKSECVLKSEEVCVWFWLEEKKCLVKK
jgi:hypothetical protein